MKAVQSVRNVKMGLKRRLKEKCSVHILFLIFVTGIVMILSASVAVASFNAISFITNNTTFFSDFREFREQWFAVEEQIFGIEDIYAPVDWSAIRDSAKEVVMKHERIMIKFIRDARSSRDTLPQDQVSGAQGVIEKVLEYIDSVGLVVLKLYEISEQLHRKTVDPFSYTMTDYNQDVRQLKQLYATFHTNGNELNQLFYGR
jgi:hypothetical protein